MTDIKKILLGFADHLGTYKGLEEIRFDFMVIDYLNDKNRCSVCGEDISSDNFYGLCKDHWQLSDKPIMTTNEKLVENELYKRILKR